MAVEHPQHTVDLGRNRRAEARDPLHVLLEHHRRRQALRGFAHALEEPLGVGEQLFRGQRDLRAPHQIFVMEIETRVGPQQQLMKRGLAVD